MSLRRHLDSLVFYDDLRLNLPGYKLARADNLRNNKRGKVGIYFKETAAVWPVPINSLKEGLLQVQKSSLCIDSVFQNQPNFVTDSGVHSFLHPNFHNQFVFSKLNLKFEYPVLYERLLRD